MARLSIAPIVEGHGDEAAVRELLWRVWTEVLGGEHVEILKPVRTKRDRLLRYDDEISKTVNLASLKLMAAKNRPLILFLIDAEDDCVVGKRLGPALLSRVKVVRSDIDSSVVIANKMFETWFVASASAPRVVELLELKDAQIPQDPEGDEAGKGWIKRYFKNYSYSETVDQVKFVNRLDLSLCQEKSASFRKLVRELKARM